MTSLDLTAVEWRQLVREVPSVLSTRAAGCWDEDSSVIVIFLDRMNDAHIVSDLVECWLHEYVELQIGGAYDHDYYAELIKRTTELVLAF